MSAIAELMAALDKSIGENSEAQGVTRYIDTGYQQLTLQ
jgi:hypothetical protein